VEGQGIEIYDMPEHGPEGATGDWPMPAAPASGDFRAHASSSVASEINRLLNAAREALEQVASEPPARPVEEFQWPEWSGGVSVRSTDAPPESEDAATIRIVLGRFRLSPSELASFRGGEAIRLAGTTGGVVEIHAGGCLRARGTLVVMEDRFGVRVTELVANDSRAGSSGS
jgi:flagellar motor switch/type III secretory pathway protein FliN